MHKAKKVSPSTLMVIEICKQELYFLWLSTFYIWMHDSGVNEIGGHRYPDHDFYEDQ